MIRHPNLVTHYKCNSNIIDSSVSGLNATAGTNTIYASGKFGNALYSPGMTSLAGFRLPKIDHFFGTRKCCVSMWIKQTKSTIGDDPDYFISALLDQQYNVGASRSLLHITSTGIISFQNSYAGNNTYINGTTNIYDNVWHHVLAQKEGASGSLYLDGVLHGSTTSFVIIPNITPSEKAIGSAWQNDSTEIARQRGYIDDVQIYTDVLFGPSDVKRIMSGLHPLRKS
jgi:hypothetical protein